VLTLFLGKEYDPEFICQSLYTIYSFIFHSVGLERILNEGAVLMKILELIEDPNEGVREIND
jgi:Kinesin-associated protein (KAP)